MVWMRKLLACTWADRWLLLQAAAWLAVVRAAILGLPFRKVVRLLGMAEGESQTALGPGAIDAATRIGWAVRAIAPHTPWQSACLAQALAGAVLLRQRGIPGTLCLGVAKQPGLATDLAAHAWLRCGQSILTGAAGYERYAVVAAYSVAGPIISP